MTISRSHCHQCGRPDRECGRVSKRGLCNDCATGNMMETNRQLATKSGPVYNLWRARHTAGVTKYVQRVTARIDAEARRLDQLNGNS